jgi:hypothetical protein
MIIDLAGLRLDCFVGFAASQRRHCERRRCVAIQAFVFCGI